MTLQFIKINDDGKAIEVVKEAYLNGYLFSERLLEDVYFGFRVTEDGDDIEVFIHPESEEYFKNFDQKKWFAIAKEYALEYDIFDLTPMSDEAVVLYDWSKPYTDQEAHFDCEPFSKKNTIPENITEPTTVTIKPIKMLAISDVFKTLNIK